jgi:hypothetical protein
MTHFRHSVVALYLATAAWIMGLGCATPGPMIEPAFAARTYTPLRIALLPPDVFLVVDQFGDNDPVASAALGQAVSARTVEAINAGLRSRGYDVDLSARWDGIVAPNGAVLVDRDQLGWLASGVAQFASSPDAGGSGPMASPAFVAPELAARVGWATQSDALLYVNVKGVTVTAGKRTAEVLAAVFIVVIIAAIILALAASGKNGGHGSSPTAARGGSHGSPVLRGSPPGARVPPPSPLRGSPPGGAVVPPPGRGFPPPRGPVVGRTYGGGPRLGVGVALVVPLDGPAYTHDGTVDHEDEMFAGDQVYVSMTMISAQDGRVLWHQRQSLDLDAQDPRDVDAMVRTFVDGIPLRGGLPEPARQ